MLDRIRYPEEAMYTLWAQTANGPRFLNHSRRPEGLMQAGHFLINSNRHGLGVLGVMVTRTFLLDPDAPVTTLYTAGDVFHLVRFLHNPAPLSIWDVLPPA